MLVPLLAWAAPGSGKPRVQLETSKGIIVIELEPTKAPLTVNNFLDYVRAGFFDGTVFHRVIPGFMIQGGGYTANLERKQTREPILNEATNGLKNLKGTIAMARTAEVNSATAQFFINLVDNAFLDHRSKTDEGFGYCVFGQVVEGMQVVEAIGAVPTGAAGPFSKDVPKTAVVITRATVVGAKPASQTTAPSGDSQPARR
ncbi:MAG: peptidyl-prolyl cis-trans isomerase [Thermoanaerobaculaceae bacterium]|nr:peptidyl-prolyl cis-trans isomerase [Thermoanaerobaculaceae bacterium]